MLRFDEVARNIAERVDDPSSAGVDRYVGLEHVDPETLRISRWGSPSDVQATKLRFAQGDVIFGRRRAYQRKLAQADWPGICSAHAMVLRAVRGVVLPEFLPLLMQTDWFFARALAISVGSLSPTINWPALAREEFLVPPLDEQARLAAVLHAVRLHREALQLTQTRALIAADVLFESLTREAGHPRVRLEDVFTASPESGHSAPERAEATGHLVLGLQALSKHGYVPGQFKQVDPTPEMLRAGLARGDVLVSRSNTIDRVGFAAIYDEDRPDVSFPDTMMRLRLNEEHVLPRFVVRALMSPAGRRHIRRVAAGTSASMKKINRKGLNAFELSLPALDEQRRVITQMEMVERLVDEAAATDRAAREMYVGLREELLGD